MQGQPFIPLRLIMKTTARYRNTSLFKARQAGLLVTLCVVLAGCGNQTAGNAGMPSGVHDTVYLLFPLTLSAASPGAVGTRDAGDMPTPVERHAVEMDDIASGTAALSMPAMQAPVVRGINRMEQIIGSYRLASGEKRAFLWTASHRMQDLNDLVRDKPAGLTLSDALAISDAGAIVAQGNTGLVLLRPISKAVVVAGIPSGD